MTTSTYNPVSKPKVPKYPYLGRASDGDIVHFTNPNTGYLLVTEGIHGYMTGYFSETWKEPAFTPLQRGESVTITQE